MAVVHDDVPTGVVLIKNVGQDDEYLYAANDKDLHWDARRLVFTWNGRDKHGTPTPKFLWRIEKIDGAYVIKNVGQDNEYLHATDDKDPRWDTRRLVFTWDGRDKHGAPAPKFLWRIEKYDGAYVIKNVGKDDEYLYAADDKDPRWDARRRVFTWDGRDKHGTPTPKFLWKIEPCSTYSSSSAAPKRQPAPKKRAALTCRCYGTKKEPCFHFENVFNEPKAQRGKTVENFIVHSFHGKKLPRPKGKEHWRSWKHGNPASGKALIPKARELHAYLRAHHRGDWHVDADPRLGFSYRDINVTGEGGGHAWHQDAQEYGRLLFLFFSGNTATNVIRVGGKHSKDERSIVVRSGDCLVFEGQTWHTVRKIHPRTSPFKNEDWLHNRRMSVLLRQHTSKTKPRRPRFLEK